MSKTRLFRCYNCEDPERNMPGRDFSNETGVCPHCSLSKDDKDYGNLITTLRVIHYEAPHKVVKFRGCGKLACSLPRQPLHMVTGDVDVVNCPNCRKSAAWIEAKAKKDSSPDDVEIPDFQITVDLKNQQLIGGG